MIKPVFDPAIWSRVPFHFWSAVFFVFGAMVGSFLNVCIHRLPLGLSVVSPPSHCPRCKYSIPWYLNIPLFTWVFLKGKCRNCGEPISPRYFLVELLTAAAFLCCWLRFGHESVLLAVIYAIFLAGLIAATFIDFEHFIIPDEITIGGMAAGFIFSCLVPALHGEKSLQGSIKQSLLGMAVGAGVVYFILRGGKLLFGRQKLKVPAEGKIIFTEQSVVLPDREVPYEEIFYRKSDTIKLHARTVELADRCYRDVTVRLSPERLQIQEETLDPEQVPYLEAASDEIIFPREAMGLGDVKFMGGIGAFLGWPSVIFSLMVSSVLGSLVGIGLIATGKREWSSRLPYGPYIAAAAVIWVFAGRAMVRWYYLHTFGFPH